jgi:hypothetical protein
MKFLHVPADLLDDALNRRVLWCAKAQTKRQTDCENGGLHGRILIAALACGNHSPSSNWSRI